MMGAKTSAQDVRSGVPQPLTRALAGCRKGLYAAGLFSLFESILLLVVPFYSFQVFDRVLTSRSENTLLMMTIFAVGALVFLALLNGMRAQVMSRVGLWIDAHLSGALFAAGVTNARQGDERGVMGLRDLGMLRGFIGGPGIVALFELPTVPIFVAATFLIHPVLGWIATGGSVTLVGFALVNYLATRQRLAAAGLASASALATAAGIMRNADAIEGMGMMPQLMRRWEGANAQVLAMQADAADRVGTIAAATKFVRLLIQIVTMAAGAYLAIHQEITGGMMIAASIVAARGLAPVETALASWTGMLAAREAWQRIKGWLEREALRKSPLRLPDPKGDLSLEKVVFVAPKDPLQRPILKGVSFSLAAGESLGIIGPTAAGKTTLARLLVGCIAPTAGNVRLDFADIHAWDREDFGRNVGYLPQDVQLMPGTVADNIARMGHPEPTDVVAAATMAGVHELILRLPNGYDTRIGDGGMPLSGGQKQRIALARCLYRNPRFLVLDEPNSNLDTEGEEELLQVLAAAKAEAMTVVIVTHRPHILQRVDKIAIIADGQLTQIGPRDEMMARFGRPSVAAPQRSSGGER
jgi:ATP-binding cassette subfamily C protein/ATP-binding cassette subfamily C protein EexD